MNPTTPVYTPTDAELRAWAIDSERITSDHTISPAENKALHNLFYVIHKHVVAYELRQAAEREGRAA